jgi:hypothetical protein
VEDCYRENEMREREDLQDRDTSVGRDRAGQAKDPSAGHAAPPSADYSIGLAGAHGAVDEGGPANSPERPDPRDVPATGIETGNASLGSSTNAAVRPDEFNTPANQR